ncbi:MAG: hypothetical protein QOJ19_66 [Acidimicrobiia bacterium]|nr:hypothetical protein [Acidimicrobiia bacterium]
MAKYLVGVKYTPEAAKAVTQEGYSSRQAVNEKLFEALGGRIEQFLWTAGGDLDLVGLAELPASAIPTLKAIVDGAGTFAYARIVEVFDSATMDAAAAAGSNYRPVGQ